MFCDCFAKLTVGRTILTTSTAFLNLPCGQPFFTLRFSLIWRKKSQLYISLVVDPPFRPRSFTHSGVCFFAVANPPFRPFSRFANDRLFICTIGESFCGRLITCL